MLHILGSPLAEFELCMPRLLVRRYKNVYIFHCYCALFIHQQTMRTVVLFFLFTDSVMGNYNRYSIVVWKSALPTNKLWECFLYVISVFHKHAITTLLCDTYCFFMPILFGVNCWCNTLRLLLIELLLPLGQIDYFAACNLPTLSHALLHCFVYVLFMWHFQLHGVLSSINLLMTF